MARRKKQETKYLDGNDSLFQNPRFSQYEGMSGMYLITYHFSDGQGRWIPTNISPSGYSDPLINTVGAVGDVIFETLLGVGKGKENRESAQKKVDKVVGDLGLTKAERRELHEEITGNDYMDYHEMVRIAKLKFNPINVNSSKGNKPRW